MRIRKNRKFPPVSSELKVHRNPHICLLNQSPWDVISFSTGPDFDFESSLLQFGRDARLDINANSAVERETESVERITIEKVEKVKRTEMSDFKFEDEKFHSDLKFFESSRSNEKNEDSGLITSRFAHQGNEEDEDGIAELCRSKRRAAVKALSLSSSRKGYYYYSELGPLRGKKRVIGGGDDQEETEIISCYCY